MVLGGWKGNSVIGISKKGFISIEGNCKINIVQWKVNNKTVFTKKHNLFINIVLGVIPFISILWIILSNNNYLKLHKWETAYHFCSRMYIWLGLRFTLRNEWMSYNDWTWGLEQKWMVRTFPLKNPLMKQWVVLLLFKWNFE